MYFQYTYNWIHIEVLAYNDSFSFAFRELLGA